MSEPLAPEMLAAVDLGSNSFHMVVARLVGDRPVMVDRIREQVQLRAGLDDRRRILPEARARALDCLERFGQRVRALSDDHVRIVGTNTLRNARDADDFIEEAEARLGHPIEVIPGSEEARLIYLGVSHTTPETEGRRLVVDIGGGSTECILGEGFEARWFQSLEMGCVSYSTEYFGDGTIRRKAMEEAEIAAGIELRRHERRFRRKGWTSAFGASGTIKAVHDVLRENGWGSDAILPEGVEQLRRALIDCGRIDRLALPGLRPDRAPVFPGGVAILSAVFESLKLDRLDVASGALREGLVYDLLGRLRREDVRDRTIRQFEERYDVDRAQADRVERTALACFDQVKGAWGLDRVEARRFLGWAARLHEMGLAVAYERHHRHGAYLVANSEMPGFSRDAQQTLACLIEGHRRKIRRTLFEHIPERRVDPLRRLLVLLRLAVRLHRARDAAFLPEIELEADGDRLRISCVGDWMARQPLTRADLEREAERVEALGVRMKVVA